jgi:hypothetical protein
MYFEPRKRPDALAGFAFLERFRRVTNPLAT